MSGISRTLPKVRTLPKACTVVVVAENDFVRLGIGAILKRARKFQVLGSVQTERDACATIEDHPPQVLILDLFLGHRDGISLIKDLVSRYPGMAILALSESSDEAYAERVMRAGAHGFLFKNAAKEDLLAAVEHLRQGHRYLTRRCMFVGAGLQAPLGVPPESDVALLTDRELHVFRLIGLSLGTGAIAQELGLSRKTIECYNDNIKRKLDLVDAAGLRERAKAWMSSVETRPFGWGDETKTGDDP